MEVNQKRILANRKVCIINKQYTYSSSGAKRSREIIL